jgi:hypothetical protein
MNRNLIFSGFRVLRWLSSASYERATATSTFLLR